jgi:hypothetical protein
MTTTSTQPDVAVSPQRRPSRATVRWDRVALGTLLTATGVGWLLQESGVAVPWHLGPAVGLILVGAALLASLAGGTGRGGLVALGAVLSVIALAVGTDAGRFTGPATDLVLRPGPVDWTTAHTYSAGRVVVALDDAALPAAGRLDLDVGAGRIQVQLPADRPVRVDVAMVAGTVTVDGVAVAQGVDLHWTDPTAVDAPLVVSLDVGAGDVEVIRAPR